MTTRLPPAPRSGYGHDLISNDFSPVVIRSGTLDPILLLVETFQNLVDLADFIFSTVTFRRSG
ncbi:MAG: hypothetical protein EBR20_02860 [Bacteroidetes bacterium]|nr:hypothetical protein [Bacteroidota bacterium]